MAPRKATLRAPRSKKAGQPAQDIPVTPRVRRRQKTATAAMRKDTAVYQTSENPTGALAGIEAEVPQALVFFPHVVTDRRIATGIAPPHSMRSSPR